MRYGPENAAPSALRVLSGLFDRPYMVALLTQQRSRRRDRVVSGPSSSVSSQLCAITRFSTTSSCSCSCCVSLSPWVSDPVVSAPISTCTCAKKNCQLLPISESQLELLLPCYHCSAQPHTPLKHPFTKEQARPSVSGMQYRFHRAQVPAQHRLDAGVHVLVQHATSVRRWIQVVWATAPQTEPFPGAASV